jgi:uncharacterized protein
MRGRLRRLGEPFQIIRIFFKALLVVCLCSWSAFAQNVLANPPVPKKPHLGTIADRINANTVAIISGNINATYLTIAYDLSAVLDDGDNFRVLPIIGKGGGQNITDVRFLKGVDLGITQSILLNNLKRSKEAGNIAQQIVYIAKLFNEEMHVVVRTDSGITSLEQLSGKKVNFSDVGSGTQLSTRDIFSRLNIQATEVNIGQADAFEQLKSGEIAATINIAGKPTAAMGKLKADDGFRFLPISFAKQLQDDYLPATLTKDDYPGMISAGKEIDTIAVGAVLIAYKWPKGSDRYRRIEKFVNQFFPRLAEFQKPPRHPKWREANLASTLPGWTRFEAAEQWLQRNRPPPVANAREQFNQFLAERGNMSSMSNTPADRDRLFQEFIKWTQNRDRR